MKRITARMARKVHIATAKFLMKLEAAHKKAKKSKLIFGCAVALLAFALSGCASLYDAQRRTNNHARQSIIQAVPLQGNGIGAGVGLNVLALFDSASAMPQTGGEWTTAIVAFVTDAAAAIGTGYAAYQAAQPSGASTASAPPATVNVSGNQGPTSVTVNYGKKKP